MKLQSVVVMDDEEGQYEQTLLVLNECFVYKIPPRVSAQGYKAGEWGDLEQYMWKGRLRITAVGPQATVILEDTETGKVFASCKVNNDDAGPQNIEPVTDSSRYFVLRIEDGRGRHAFIGMGFNERTDALDFKIAIQDHKKYLRQKEELKRNPKKFEGPKMDLGFKEGQTIRVNIKHKKPEGASDGAPQFRRGLQQQKQAVAASSSSTGGFGLLPPPPGSSHRRAQSSGSAAQVSSAAQQDSSSPFGDLF